MRRRSDKQEQQGFVPEPSPLSPSVGVDARVQGTLMVGQAQASRERPVRALDVDAGTVITVTVGAERFGFPDGSHFEVGPMSIAGVLRSEETPAACYARLYEAGLVLLEVEFQTKLEAFCSRRSVVAARSQG